MLSPELPSAPAPDPVPGPLSPEATVHLLAQMRAGNSRARDRLLERCLPPLRRWAHGRLPAYARDALDTGDLVQETVVAVLKQLDGFEPRREGALQAYLRVALDRRIKDVIRIRRRRPPPVELPDDLLDHNESPLDAAVGAENRERIDRALLTLRDGDREAIICRIELGYGYEELAVALGKPTANAARVAVVRALGRLAEAMRDLRPAP